MKEIFLIPQDAKPPSSLPFQEISDRAFEIAVFEAAKSQVSQLAGSNNGTEVELTSQSADRGRDIVIRNFTQAQLFGLELGREGIPKTIFLECKLTNKRRLTLEHVGANVFQIEPESDTTVFVLVTNATLTPRAACLIERQCSRLAVGFLLIDAWNMQKCIPNLTSNIDGIIKKQDIFLSYQILKEGNDKSNYTIHFLIRSMADRRLRFDLSLHSTRDWNGRPHEIQDDRHLKAGGLGCSSISIAPKGLKMPRLLTIATTIDGKHRLHKIPLVAGDDIANLPLFASQMTHELVRLKQELSAQTISKLVHIHGKAGSGKSRLLLEMFEAAQTQGLACRYITILDGGDVIVSTTGYGERDRKRPQIVQLSDLLGKKSKIETGGRQDLLLVDDLHKATAPLLQDISTFALGTAQGMTLIVAGRSDPTFRRQNYEDFVRRMTECQLSDVVEQIVLGDMNDSEVRSALTSIFKDETPGFFKLKDTKTHLRPVDLVHAVHSLLERNQVEWADEERLALNVSNDIAIDYFTGDSVIGGILGFRYEHLSHTTFENFTLAGFLEILAVIDDPTFSYLAARKLLDTTDIAEEILLLWLYFDDSHRRAEFRHSSLKDYLNSKFYGFDTSPQCGAILQFSGENPKNLSSETKAAFALSDGDLKQARILITPFAKRLQIVTNISSLSLREGQYLHFATLFSILQDSNSTYPYLQHRCLIARAYLNSHHRSYAHGFIDNLRLVGLVSALPDHPKKGLTVAGVKQLMAHALINSGDSKTALSLMHEVEILLERYDKTKAACAIEFDMCDRLQSYYAAQSAFGTAKLFFLRARSCAHFVRSPALMSLSFSAEFHLSRYLDIENAARLSERQLKHAIRGIPERTIYHAKVNDLVARWTVDETKLKESPSSEFHRLRADCENFGFGHLVPRLDYLLAVVALLHWRNGDHPLEVVDTAIGEASKSAHRYGYGEYVWLLGSLDLIKLVDCEAPQEQVIQKAIWLIDHIHDQGLAFVAGDELCFQNTVALSNGLRAIHQNTDQKTAWRYAEKISFSPLFLPNPSDQTEHLESVFAGEMINRVYDPRALVRDHAGYAIILV